MTTLSQKERAVIFACVHNAHAEFGPDRKSVALLSALKAAKKELGVDVLGISPFMQAWKVMTNKKEQKTELKLLMTCPSCGEWNIIRMRSLRMTGHFSVSLTCENPFCAEELDTVEPFQVAVVPKEDTVCPFHGVPYRTQVGRGGEEVISGICDQCIKEDASDESYEEIETWED